MVDKGKKLYVSEVGGWYDCGKVDTLLETNSICWSMVELGVRQGARGVKIKDPVYVEDGVTLKDATIGPNVSIEAGSTILGSTIANSILGRGTNVKDATVEGSLIGIGRRSRAQREGFRDGCGGARTGPLARLTSTTFLL